MHAELQNVSHSTELEAAILESITDAFFALNNDWRFVYVNAHAEKILARTRADLLGRNVWEEFAPAVGSDFHREYHRAKEQNTAVRFEAYYEPLGTWFDVHAYPSAEGLSVYFQKVNESKQAETALRDTEERLRFALAASSTGTWDYHPATGELIWDERCRSMFGLSPEEPVTYQIFIDRLDPEDRERTDQAVQQAIRPGAGDFKQEFRVACPDGSKRWIQSNGRAFFAAGETVAGRFTGTVTDITDRKLAETSLAEQAEKLARSNADLQQFAYVVSHDLQEPLRTVTAFSQLVCRRYSGTLDAEGEEMLQHIAGGARRMQNLIDALLSFSQVVNVEGSSFGSVRLDEVLHWALMNLETALRETGGEVQADALPEVHGDGVQLIQLFQNLIGNAIKYRRPDQPPRIQVTARRRGGEWLLTLADNGIGIDPAHSNRIFGVFKRLHGAEIPGTGIGLAISKRIVERHGGRIWVEGEPGVGSTFFFTLPANESPPPIVKD